MIVSDQMFIVPMSSPYFANALLAAVILNNIRSKLIFEFDSLRVLGSSSPPLVKLGLVVRWLNVPV